MSDNKNVNSLATVILAAGMGKRLKWDSPKPLAPANGKYLVDYVVNGLKKFYKDNKISGELFFITGYRKEEVESHLKSTLKEQNMPWTALVQDNQSGTGDAIRTYFAKAPKALSFTYTLVICADTPLITEKELKILWEKRQAVDAIAATFETKNPTGYGRIVRGKTGFKIVEEKDCTSEEKKINEVNAGLYIVKTTYLNEFLKRLNNNNKSGEFYLTDLFQENQNVVAEKFSDPHTFEGVNTLAQLEFIEMILRQRKIQQLREQGVRFIDATTTYIEQDVEIGPGSIIYPNVFLQGNTKIGSETIIETGTIIKNTKIEEKVHIKAHCYITDSEIQKNAVIGPFAHLRPETKIGPEVKIGNFVEIKKSSLAKGAKVSHLSYVGDAEIGEESNLGCGFITCNYDGEKKHKTIIGARTFVGSDSQVVAPLTIGNDCYVASSTTVTHNMADGSFAISRGRQVTKEGLAKKFLKAPKP
jgi:bifunctional UDP-N-acetylglucosamine pyrophosphorylase/glucosamine-1-phosphate N-acetyltransferase